MAETPLLADLLKQHLATTGGSARALAEKLGASYPSVLAWMGRGGVPRKPEHREGLRRELALAPDVFARVLAASSKEPIDIPNDGPLDLRQLLLRYLGERNLTERTFADLAGIPYATLMGVTRRGAVPRAGTLEQLATAMSLGLDVVREAAARTREEAEAAGHAVEVTEEPDPRPSTASFTPVAAEPEPALASAASLARLASERIAASGLSAAAYARTHDLPYLALSRLLSSGEEPQDEQILAQLRAAFPAAPVPAAPAPAKIPSVPADEGTRALHRSDDTAPPAGHPLHAALLKLVQQKGWNQQRFAQACNLAVPTAARLLKGELPGRGPTHQKLRDVLGLDEAAYRALLPPMPEAGEEPSSSSRRPAAKSDPEDPEVAKLSRAIRTLDDSQREAVWKLVKTFKDGG